MRHWGSAPRGGRRSGSAGEGKLFDDLTSLAPALGPLGIIDFVLVWYIVYTLLLIVRGTRTVPMAVGLLILFTVYQAARWLGLVTLYTLLHTFVSVIVIFALIVFQDDIRRALFRVGRFARFSRAQEAQVVEEVIRGATSLAKRRIGALIVFEREARLDDFIIEAGTSLDAAVTRELLYAVFIPSFENPVHDGAVIIRNYRLHMAGAFLPLTRNPKVEKTLGTRHRAAIGVTEEADAVAVVVSEERGTISLCHDGQIETGLDPARLRKELLALFAGSRRPWRSKDAREEALAAEPELELETEPDRERRTRAPREDLTDAGRPTTFPKAKAEDGERPSGGARKGDRKGERARTPTWPGVERRDATPPPGPVRPGTAEVEAED